MTDAATAYDRAFLEENGYFSRESSDATAVDGESIPFAFDPRSRLAYFEDIDPDTHSEVVKELRRTRNFDYYWFWNADDARVAVYRTHGENKWFVFNQSLSRSDDAVSSDRSKLETIDTGFNDLFDIRAVVNRFYRQLWDIRLDLARAYDVPASDEVSDKEKLLAAQRTIDRLIFSYFLVEKNIIHAIDDANQRLELDSKETFLQLEQYTEFGDFLNEIFFEYLNSKDPNEYPITDSVSIFIPYLNGGLFREHRIPTRTGGTVSERDLDTTSFDWRNLVDELNGYNWLIDDYPDTENEGNAAAFGGRDTANKLSPAVLGHIYEKFVITISELSEEEQVTLDELDDLDITDSGEQLLKGNKKAGAYYTPDYIATENTRETLWSRVTNLLVREHGIDGETFPGPVEYFERALNPEAENPEGVTLELMDGVLAELTALDPSVGSGAFLRSLGDILEDWRIKCSRDATPDKYRIRRSIVRNSLHGVDLLEGATEICKFRLWLWLISASTVDLTGENPKSEPLPNIDFNVRQGNSLIGVASADVRSLLELEEFDWIDGERIKYPEAVEQYQSDIAEYQRTHGAAAEEVRQRLLGERELLNEKLNSVYVKERDVRVEQDVSSFDKYLEIIDEVEGRVKLNLDFDSAMRDEERSLVSGCGFREQKNWKTTAYHRDTRKTSASAIEEVFEMMADQGSVSVERPLLKSDIETLEPFHWLFEFPESYAPNRGVYFDIIIGNPPHGSTLRGTQKRILEDTYDLIEDDREVAKMFTERSWKLTDGELSFIVPKAGTYNSTWRDYREFCQPKLARALDLGKAFRNVQHEQVTIHLSQDVVGADSYECGALPEGETYTDDVADMKKPFADHLGTIPVNVSPAERDVAEGLYESELPQLGDFDIDVGRGTGRRYATDDPSEPIAFQGREVKRYFTKPASDRVDDSKVTGSGRKRMAQPKVIAQNLIAHVQNPYDHVKIAAVYDPSASFNFETVTNIVVNDDDAPSNAVMALLLNSPIVNWFTYILIYNRAIRDMHFDDYFLRNFVLPESISDAETAALENLYYLLSITRVVANDVNRTNAAKTHDVLDNVAAAACYELYLRELDGERKLETRLLSLLMERLADASIDYGTWFTNYVSPSVSVDSTATSRIAETSLTLADELAAVTSDTATATEMRRIAEHPWVRVIERDHLGEVDGDTDWSGIPNFGPR
ncbi:Eco57I restriction-modification methylase domain-containing protein [Haladaptatus halobius]|uniref:Eco57I restriction-modification methylase domain-containing protein n=1 Tax=Haladaptatus halobius TaxID=2884875 RepID=UPI001D0ABD18|nr:Eco57I restriction-modification methylase domain-containing protein [Haladaptatus halobius]